MPDLYTAAQAETVLGIPAATVRQWKRRGRIWPFGLDERDHPMYRRADLIRLRDAQQKPNDQERTVSGQQGFEPMLTDVVTERPSDSVRRITSAKLYSISLVDDPLRPEWTIEATPSGATHPDQHR